MRTKICTKCKIEKNIFEFYKSKTNKNRLSWCKCCFKQYYKDNAEKKAEYYKGNAEEIAKQKKQYRKNNAEKLAKLRKQYCKDNAEKMAEYQKQYYKDNAEKLAKYRQDNAERIAEYQKQHYKNNAEKTTEQRKQYRKNNALFEAYSKQLEMFEKTRRCPENNELLEVKCAYCGKWLKPTNLQVRNRLQVFNGTIPGERRFYCSENCKEACPIYNQNKFPKGFKKATPREVVPLLRQLVLGRDNYTCQKCGATTQTAQLHVHHIIPYTQNKMQANDPDSCITFCKECHKKVHQQDGCKYSDLSC